MEDIKNAQSSLDNAINLSKLLQSARVKLSYGCDNNADCNSAINDLVSAQIATQAIITNAKFNLSHAKIAKSESDKIDQINKMKHIAEIQRKMNGGIM